MGRFIGGYASSTPQGCQFDACMPQKTAISSKAGPVRCSLLQPYSNRMQHLPTCAQV